MRRATAGQPLGILMLLVALLATSALCISAPTRAYAEEEQMAALAQSVQFGTWYDGSSGGDAEDAYEIEVVSPGRLTIDLESTLADARLSVVSTNWQVKRDAALGVQTQGDLLPLYVIDQDGISGAPNAPTTKTLSAWVSEGTYTLQVTKGEQGTPEEGDEAEDTETPARGDSDEVPEESAADGRGYRFKVTFDDAKVNEREFNDDIRCAQPIEAKKTFSGLLAPWGKDLQADPAASKTDVDWYAIEAPSDAPVVITVKRSASSGALTLEAVDPSMVEKTEDGLRVRPLGVDPAQGEMRAKVTTETNGDTYTFTFVPLEFGTQYLMVRPAQDDADSAGPYSISWQLDFTAANMDEVEAQTYTGKAVCPKPNVWLSYESGYRQLKEGVDYTLSYQNNVNMGIATVTATGKGSYVGSLSATFRIASDGPFADVASVTAHESDILWLRSQGITSGWTEDDGYVTFRPNAGVKRGDMAAFLFRLAKNWGLVSDSWQPNSSQRNAFRDVNGSTAHSREIWWLAAKGISTGWKASGGMEYRPNAEVKRGDMAAFLFRLAKLANKGDALDSWKASSAQSRTFRDVSGRTSHSREIWWLAAKGVSSGWAVGSSKEFRPNTTVKRGDMAAFLYRMNGLKKTTTPAKPSTPSTPTTPTKPSTPTTPTTPTSDYVLVTRTGKKYHRPSGCRSTSGKVTTRLTLEEAKRKGYTPCANCYH